MLGTINLVQQYLGSDFFVRERLYGSQKIKVVNMQYLLCYKLTPPFKLFNKRINRLNINSVLCDS